jgi:flagellar motility protein MotE (MotC chaperone)
MKWRTPRLLPVAVAVMGGLALLKAETLWHAAPLSGGGLVVPSARASEPAAAPAAAQTPAQAPAAPRLAAAEPPPAPPDPAALAERALLEQLRARRAELEAREAAMVSREQLLAAAERRLAQRIEELGTLQQRLEALERGRVERDEAGWRGLVRVYETMRPREAAAIFDSLEMPVLVELLDRMGERRAAPVIGAMRPERARELTAELARHRAQRPPVSH